MTAIADYAARLHGAAPVAEEAGAASSMAELVDRVRACANRPGDRDFFSLLISLSRGVDYALARNEVPAIVKDLPLIVKLAYQRKNDVRVLSATMVLMNSIQNACRCGWFDDTEVGEFTKVAKELYNYFSGRGDSTTEPTVVRDVVSVVMPRFLPQFELGKIILSIEAKPGYEVLLAEFLISKLFPPTANEKIRLLAVQIDNMETSSCIINPPGVNIMVNGRVVENITPGLMLPLDVTRMLIFGTNLLQVVGQFSGNYVIILAHMSPRLKSHFQVCKEKLHDYTFTEALEKTLSDDDIIEGPSKISLKCPISFKRITTPVKGHSCRHRQCFDYDNYVVINTRRPSWHCPHCNQSVSFCDIRVDRKMVEVLSQLGDNVEDVLILADGSWRISSEDFSINVPKNSYPLNQRVELDMQPDGIKLDKTKSQNEILDLTLDDIDNSAADSCVGNYDTKPLDDSWSGLLDKGVLHSSVSTFGSAMQASGYVTETCDDIWSRLEFLTGSTFNGGQNLGAPLALASTTPYPGNRMSESFGVPHSSVFGMSSNSASAMANTGFSSLNRAATLTPERTATHNSIPAVSEAVTPTLNRAATLFSERPATHNSTSVVTEAVTPTLNRAVILPSERSATHNYTSVVTEAVFPALSRAATLTPIPPSIQTVERRPRGNSANSMQLMLYQQEMQLLRQLNGISENSVANIDEARQRSLYHRHVARTPISVQALPAQPLRYTPSASHQRPSRPVSHEMASSARGLLPTNTHAFACPITPVSNNTFNGRVTGTERPWTYSTASDQIVALPATNWGNMGLRSSISPPVSRVFTDNQQTPNHHQQTLNTQNVTPSNLSTLRHQSSRSSVPPPTNNSGRQQQLNQAVDPLSLQMLVASQMRMGGSPGVGVHHATSISANSMRPPQATVTQLRNVSGVGHSVVETQSGNASFPELPSDQNWQPSGLMRGSITGRSCSPAISQLVLQPSSSAATSSETRLGGYPQRTD